MHICIYIIYKYINYYTNKKKAHTHTRTHTLMSESSIVIHAFIQSTIISYMDHIVM